MAPPSPIILSDSEDEHLPTEHIDLESEPEEAPDSHSSDSESEEEIIVETPPHAPTVHTTPGPSTVRGPRRRVSLHRRGKSPVTFPSDNRLDCLESFVKELPSPLELQDNVIQTSILKKDVETLQDSMYYVPGPQTMHDIDLQLTTLGNHVSKAHNDIEHIRYRTTENVTDIHVLRQLIGGMDSKIRAMDEAIKELFAIVKKIVEPKK